jgi:hypothetical protein
VSLQYLENSELEESSVVELLEDSEEDPSSQTALVVKSNNPRGVTRRKSSLASTDTSSRFEVLEESTPEEDPAAENRMVVANSTSQALVPAKPSGQLTSNPPDGSLWSGAASLVMWMGGNAKAPVVPTSSNGKNTRSPQNSDTDEDDDAAGGDQQPHSSGSSSSLTEDIAAAQGGVLDTLLLVRQSIQRIGQLSWGVRTSYHTSSIDEGDFDAFIVLCSIYSTTGVECSSDLLVRVRQHRNRLQQVLQKHIRTVLNCIVVLQRRILDEQKSIPGMTLAYRRMSASLTGFELEMDALLNNFKQLVVECSKMKAGILAMPLSHHRESEEVIGMGAYAYNSINALSARLGGTAAPSAAILTHGEYMTQLRSQLDLHWNSISHLFQSLKGTVEAVNTVNDRLRVGHLSAVSASGEVEYLTVFAVHRDTSSSRISWSRRSSSTTSLRYACVMRRQE